MKIRCIIDSILYELILPIFDLDIRPKLSKLVSIIDGMPSIIKKNEKNNVVR